MQNYFHENLICKIYIWQVCVDGETAHLKASNDTGQNKQDKIPGAGKIRTHDQILKIVEEITRLRPNGYCDRHYLWLILIMTNDT
jgi:hypothetical protein